MNEIKEQESVCLEADRIAGAGGDRQRDYSHPLDNFTKIVGAFNALTGHNLTVEQGVIFMACLKLARESYQPKRDNRVDACGYVKCLDMIHEEKARRSKITTKKTK